MRQKLFKKQFGAIALIVFLSLSSIWIILTFMYNNYLADEKYQTLQKVCETVFDFTEKNTELNEDGYDEYSIHYIMYNLATVTDCDVFITDESGVVKICGCKEWENERDCEHLGAQLDQSVINSLDLSKRNTLSTLGFYSKPHYTVTQVIEKDNVKT